MKKILFIVGPEWIEKYDTCQEIIRKNFLNDILLFDVKRFFQNVYYNNQQYIGYEKWLSFLKDEKNLICEEINKRLLMNNHTTNVVITGTFDVETIKSIVVTTKIKEYGVVFIDSTRELLYRNYTLKTSSQMPFKEFSTYIDKLYVNNLNSILENRENLKNYNYYMCIKNNSEIFINIFEKYFGYTLNKTKNRVVQKYQWPVLPKYVLLQQDLYGTRPIHMILGKPKFHSGFDITTETLTQVKASIGGIVVTAGIDERIFSGQSFWNQRYGNMVEVVDDYGRREVYAHLRKVLVNEGDVVNQGDIIGLSGCSGGARIPHLHFEIRKYNTEYSGEVNTINPLEILPEFDFNSLTKHFEEKPYSEIWEKVLKEPWGITDNDIFYANSKDFIR